MDELKKKIEELEIEGLDEVISKMETEYTDLKKSVEEKDNLIKEKDELIEQKNKDIVGARQKYNKLKELTEEEREQMSEKEIANHEAMLDLQRQQEEFKKEQSEFQRKQLNEIKNKAFKQLVGDDPELAEKLAKNFDRIKDSESATTEEEISSLANEAFNMLGADKPADVADYSGTGRGGSPDDSGSGNNFAESTAGQDLAKNLGLDLGDDGGSGEQK